ncbi:MAG: OB-fold nucleic acid binding domain-containing protein, partial [Actinomycetota bacterium]
MSDVTDAPDPTSDSAGDDAVGSGLAAERSRRSSRIAELRANGAEPYPYRFDRTHTLSELRAGWGELEPSVETDDAVAVAGRIMLKRDSGKLVFATIRDRTGDVQLFISKADLGDDDDSRAAAFDDAKALDLGDWVGVAGTVMTTRKGELSVKPIGADGITLLAKAVRPMPDKWHGLSDTDTRFRQRYADLIVNDVARRNFEIRHETVASFRRTLAAHGFVEVETPVLH